MLFVEPAVFDRGARRAVDAARPPVVENQNSIRELLDRPHVVADEDDRPPFLLEASENVEALLLKAGVAYRQDFIDQEDVGMGLDGHREGQSHQHSG